MTVMKALMKIPEIKRKVQDEMRKQKTNFVIQHQSVLGVPEETQLDITDRAGQIIFTSSEDEEDALNENV